MHRLAHAHFHKVSHEKKSEQCNIFPCHQHETPKARVNAKVIISKIGFVAFCCILKQAIEPELQQVLPSTLALHKPFLLCMKLGCLLPALCIRSSLTLK